MVYNWHVSCLCCLLHPRWVAADSWKKEKYIVAYMPNWQIVYCDCLDKLFFVAYMPKKQFVLCCLTATEFASLYQNGITPKYVWSYRICALVWHNIQHLRKNLLEQYLCRMWWYYLRLDRGLGQHVWNNSSVILLNCGKMEYIHRSHQKLVG